jgi:MFS family permease
MVGLAFAFALTAFFIFLKTWVLELGEGSLGEVFTWYAGTAIFLRLFLGHIPERFGYLRVLFPALVLTTLGLASLAFADSSFDLNVAGVLCGAGHGYAFPIISALVVKRARPENRGSAVAMFTALFDLGALIGGPSLGYIARGPGYPAMFVTASLVCLAATALFGLLERRPAARDA